MQIYICKLQIFLLTASL